MSGVLVDDYQRYHFEPDVSFISNGAGPPLHPAAAGAERSPWLGCDPLKEGAERAAMAMKQQQWQQQAMVMKQDSEPYNSSEGRLLSEEEEILCRTLCKLGIGGEGGAGPPAISGGRCEPMIPWSNKEEEQWLAMESMQDYFASDEFRMFEFKVRRCMRGRSHDWTECPFAHPGEKARRRDPRRFHYAGAACPDFRKGTCSRGDACEFSHGVFECWLHPARYRTQLCKDGTHCTRRICFFAHSPSQLRLLPSPDDLQQQLPAHPCFHDDSGLSRHNVTMVDATSVHADLAFPPSHHDVSPSMDDFTCSFLARTAAIKQATSAREGAASTSFRQLMASSKLHDPASSHLSNESFKQTMADARYVRAVDGSVMVPHGVTSAFKQAIKDEFRVSGSSTVLGVNSGYLYQPTAASNESSDNMCSREPTKSRGVCQLGGKPLGALLSRSQFWPNNDGADGISTLMSDLAGVDHCGLGKNHPARPGLLINKLSNVSGFSNQVHNHQLPSPTSTLVGHSPSPPPLSPPLSPAISPPMSPNLPSPNWSNPLVRRISAISGQTLSLDTLSQIQTSLAASQLFSNGSSLLSYAHGPSPLSCNSPVRQGHQLDRVNFNSPGASFSSAMEPPTDDQAAPRDINCSEALMANLQQIELRRVATEMRSKMRSAYLSRSLPSSPIARMGRQSDQAWDGSGGADVIFHRVDSGRDLRAKIYGKLGKDLPRENENPDFGWVNELCKSEAE